MIAAAGSIWQARAFGDDPFESESACMLQHGWPVDVEMLAEANGWLGWEVGYEPLQQVFAVLENRFRQIEPFCRLRRYCHFFTCYRSRADMIRIVP
jgi:hypothetical protein